ncbi:hypothetical protein FM111_02395 [Brevundimonas diminuta 3F5N]|uniref:Uncharacterized protein n=1 Tax=Brevundimonas diminuta 3F5N TaxID=1255603 RepID=A0A1R4F380_BREDI|nr:hypothetical protein FM111_02395 [Brevundimonas diminuta 3F5N]
MNGTGHGAFVDSKTAILTFQALRRGFAFSSHGLKGRVAQTILQWP